MKPTEEKLRERQQHENQLRELREANNRLSRQLAKAEVLKEELVGAVYQAAKDAALGLTLKRVEAPKADNRRGKEAEVAIAVLSDWQLAKVTPNYNTEVCEQRVEEYGRKVVELANIQRADHPVKELRVYLLGDIIEGELIFPGQAHLIDSSLFRQVTVDGPRILINFLRSMLVHFDKVHVVGVIGNHGSLGGRARKDYHPESNADAMLYQIVKDRLAGEPRLTFSDMFTPGERHWYLMDQVGDKKFLLFHGDQVRGFAGFPWYGFGKKVAGWFISLQNIWGKDKFHYALHGHFHTPNRMYLNGITIWGNGSTESYNSYALEQLGASGEPSQWLLFCHPRRGITAEYLVYLS